MSEIGHCSIEVYKKELNKHLQSLKRFREAWLRSTSSWDTEIFQYGDPDFYFYRFAIECQERETKNLILSILFAVLNEYKIDVLVPDDKKNAPFDFIIIDKGERRGYTFSDFYEDEDVNGIIENYELNSAFIIRTWKSGQPEKWIERENHHYKEDGVGIAAITIEQFFNTYFDAKEYSTFLDCVNDYIREAKDILGYKSIKFLSSMNYATQKTFEEKMLRDWNYSAYNYQIIDASNSKVSNYLYLGSDAVLSAFKGSITDNYVGGGLYKSLLGTNEYAQSFITSEWLFHSLKEKENFDYTSVISGYLKSIEQLLYTVVMLNVDNGCKISMSSAKNVKSKAYNNHIKIFKMEQSSWQEIITNNKKEYASKAFPYIDLITDQIEYMDSSIGTFEYFLRNNTHIFIDPSLAKIVADMVSCFRQECRNGYFHTHNLSKWDVVEKTRNNAIFLYFVILGSIVIPKEKFEGLGIMAEDAFDNLCKRIREFRHYNADFVFEYEGGEKKSYIYDFINNTVEYSKDGQEHYESLLFYEVKDFSLETYEELDRGIKEEQKLFLTRANLPKRIFGVNRDKHLEEIPLK